MILFKEYLPGILISFAVSICATILGTSFPIIGGPVFGIVFGIIIGTATKRPELFSKGIKFTSKNVLKWSIIILGCGLSFNQIFKAGISSIHIMICTLCAAFLSAYLLGKLLKIDFNLKTLIGVGTAICGGSAIAAISPIIEAEEAEVAYAISTIFLFNIIAVLIFPPLGHLLHFSNKAFGTWAGTAINDTSSVVAAGYSYSNAAGAYATIVKLTRTTMIIPISIFYAILISSIKRKKSSQNKEVNYSFKKIFPWFILGFLGTSLLNTAGIFNNQMVNTLNGLGKFMIVMALSAIGLNTDFKSMLKTGFRPLLLGLAVWFTVSIVSIIVQFATGII